MQLLWLLPKIDQKTLARYGQECSECEPRAQSFFTDDSKTFFRGNGIHMPSMFSVVLIELNWTWFREVLNIRSLGLLLSERVSCLQKVGNL